MAYRKLDLSKVQFSDEIVSMDKALKNVPPIDIPEEVLQGKKKLKVSNPKIDKTNNRVGVKINYV